MTAWQFVMTSLVLGSLLGYLALAFETLRRRNGPAWTALQATVIGELVRVTAWAWRMQLHPELYRTVEPDIVGVVIGQSIASVAVWVLAVQMRRAYHNTPGGTP